MKREIQIGIVVIFGVFLIFSYIWKLELGLNIGENFWGFMKTLVGIVPATFLLISLFEVWVKRETVEKHLGDESRIKGILWAILLAGTIVGGLYVALPLASVLYRKGARADVIFTFIFSATICRIPMTLFEANFVGIKFTLIRFAVSLPLVVICSIILGKIAERYRLMEVFLEK